jgi:salicylate hydroxylase
MGGPATPSTKFRIAIVGSGPIGKLLACSAPVHPRIELVQYEADTLPLRPSFGYGLGPQALTALKVANAELGGKIYDACILNPLWMRLYHGGDEERLIADSMMPEGQTHGWIGRDELLELMDRNIPENVSPVQYGKQLTGVTQSGELLELQFQDGVMHTANAIWACDGLNSLCRKVVQGSDYHPPVYSGKLCFRGKVPAQEVRAAIGDSFVQETYMFIGVDGWHILTFPIWGGDWVNVAAFASQPERKRVERDSKLTLEEVLSYFPGRNKTVDAFLQVRAATCFG